MSEANSPADEWPAGKTFGQLTPSQKMAAARRACATLQAELQANAELISAVIDGDLDD